VRAVRVPASTSNLGAGFDCLGLALDLWLEARIVDGPGPPRYAGTVSGLSAAADHVYRLAGSALQDWHLHVHSDIPVGKGLGSSAAAIVAGLALRRLLARESVDADDIYRSATAAEGHPDNAGPAVYGGLVLAARRPERLAMHDSVGVALALPAIDVNTREARALLPGQVTRERTVEQASAAAALVLGLTTGNGDLIAFGMNDRIGVPARRPLIPGYDAAVEAGVEAGAFGVTISGSGPGVLAFAPRE
jgi:homoserine kinase